MSAPIAAASLGWGGIARIGLVQASIGAIVVLMTSTINRVMVIELHLAASVPGVLLGLHYALQGLRPRWGHGADAGGRRAPWIVGGMAILAGGGTLAAVATALLRTRFGEGMALAVVAFAAIGIGVGMTGTAALTLLARVDGGVTARLRELVAEQPGPEAEDLRALLTAITPAAGDSLRVGYDDLRKYYRSFLHGRNV